MHISVEALAFYILFFSIFDSKLFILLFVFCFVVQNCFWCICTCNSLLETTILHTFCYSHLFAKGVMYFYRSGSGDIAGDGDYHDCCGDSNLCWSDAEGWLSLQEQKVSGWCCLTSQVYGSDTTLTSHAWFSSLVSLVYLPTCDHSLSPFV